MFITVDQEDFTLYHAHHDHDTASALGFLEAPHRNVAVWNTANDNFLKSFGFMDLKMFYRALTKEDAPTIPAGDYSHYGQVGDAAEISHLFLRDLIAQVIEKTVKPTLALYHELEAQIYAVSDELYKGVPWKYALGAKRPAKQIQLFPLFGMPAKQALIELAAQTAPQRRSVRRAPAKAAPAATPPQAAPAAKQRASSVRPVIWAAADRLWEEAGKPTDKAVVLELRKKMMVHLEEEKGVKRTSSSNELGNWMKARLG